MPDMATRHVIFKPQPISETCYDYVVLHVQLYHAWLLYSLKCHVLVEEMFYSEE